MIRTVAWPMSRIGILPDSVANKIAARDPVERPREWPYASAAVKFLLDPVGSASDFRG